MKIKSTCGKGIKNDLLNVFKKLIEYHLSEAAHCCVIGKLIKCFLHVFFLRLKGTEINRMHFMG